MSLEMGAPITMSREMQAEAGVGHADGFIEALEAQEERWTLPTATRFCANRSARRA
jgi:aldehyde dehydrogenase (NAD+)